MANTELKARELMLPVISTPEELEHRWDCVVSFGDRVLLAGYFYRGRYEPSYFAAVYEYTTDDHTFEGEIAFRAVSDEFFSDNGHALQWGMMN